MIGHIIVYLLLAVILFAFNVVNTSYVPFLILMLFVIISVISLAMVIILNINTEVSFKEENILATIKDKQTVSLVIRNKSFIPLIRLKAVVQVQFGRNKKKRNYTVKAYCDANSIEICEFSVDCINCEVVSMKIKKFYVYDFLNLFCLFKKGKSEGSILVLPELSDEFLIQKIGYKISNDESMLYSDKRPGDDVTEIFAIRDYVGGDKIRNIHWKLSSKRDNLMVKDYSLPLLENDVVLIDFFKFKNKNSDNRNEIFKLLYSLLCQFLKMGLRVKVCYNKDGLNICEINHMHDVYRLLAKVYEIVPYNESGNVASSYVVQEYGNEEKRFFYITGYLDNKAQSSMRILNSMGNVNYLIPGHTDKTIVPVKFEG